MTHQRYCPKHIVLKQAESAENEKLRQQIYDKEQRNQESKEFYNSKSWKEKKAEIMARHKNRCYFCGGEAKLVHHQNALVEDRDKALHNDNLVPCCYSCHNRIHAAKKHQEASDKEK
jgi:5-methylcytosine-specific restriction endonuclease McrA